MAIIKELRESLNSRAKESCRAIVRPMELEHAMLLRVAEGKKTLSMDAAERLSSDLGMQLAWTGIYVEVKYPREMRKRVRNRTLCSWHARARFDVPIRDERPNGTSGWEDTFGPFEFPKHAQSFATYTIAFLDEWMDYCVGEEYTVRLLKSDMQTPLARHHIGTIGSKIA